ncbi:MAG: hypothetical protein ACK5PF_00915, partial [bacterium]
PTAPPSARDGPTAPPSARDGPTAPPSARDGPTAAKQKGGLVFRLGPLWVSGIYAPGAARIVQSGITETRITSGLVAHFFSR